MLYLGLIQGNNMNGFGKQQIDDDNDQSDLTPFDQWFDISNIHHLKALDHYLKNGAWPKYFIPRDVDLHCGVNLLLTTIALAYIALMDQRSSVVNRGPHE